MSGNCRNWPVSKGFTLIELVVFISIMTIALTGVISALSYTHVHSPNPAVQKQALEIAESLMEEIQQLPFTYCDPNDAHAQTASSFTDCASDSQQSLAGPTPASESRYNQSNPLDNVADYGNFSMPGAGCQGICPAGDATPITGLNGYQVKVALASMGGSAAFPGVPADAVVEVKVEVAGPANTRVVLKGYRVRYAPRA
jgi:MSHA pilin protein MshD